MNIYNGNPIGLIGSREVKHNDSNVGDILDNLDMGELLANEWDSTKTYEVGDYCTHNGKMFRCLVQNVNTEPVHGTIWSRALVGGRLKQVEKCTTTKGTHFTVTDVGNVRIIDIFAMPYSEFSQLKPYLENVNQMSVPATVMLNGKPYPAYIYGNSNGIQCDYYTAIGGTTYSVPTNANIYSQIVFGNFKR